MLTDFGATVRRRRRLKNSATNSKHKCHENILKFKSTRFLLFPYFILHSFQSWRSCCCFIFSFFIFFNFWSRICFVSFHFWKQYCATTITPVESGQGAGIGVRHEAVARIGVEVEVAVEVEVETVAGTKAKAAAAVDGGWWMVGLWFAFAAGFSSEISVI